MNTTFNCQRHVEHHEPGCRWCELKQRQQRRAEILQQGGATCPVHGPYEFAERTTAGALPGASIECPACEEALQAARAALADRWRRFRLLEAAGIPERYRDSSLRTWLPQGPVQQEAAALAERWAAQCANAVNRGRGITLLGPPGVGKTHLLCGLVRHAALAGYQAHYASWAASWRSVRESAGRDLGAIAALRGVRVLALDEIAATAPTEREAAELFDLLDARYSRGLPTHLASNAPNEDALGDVIGDRALDRLRESNRLALLVGKSMRGRLDDLPGEPVEPPPNSTSVQAFDPIAGAMVARVVRNPT